jgi:ubiquinone/menaquinone biosynthesis C-methylase UbiE
MARAGRQAPGVALVPRLVAALYDLFLGPLERLGLARRRAALVGPAAGRALEVGVGTGLTLPHYRQAAEVVGIDPEPAMLERARARAAEAKVPVTLEVGPAEVLPFPAGSFDTAVASLVLCTVDDPRAAARELRRVLRPGGELRFLEHVRAPGGGLARLQDRLTPLWRRAFGNCHPNRDTLRTLEEAGFVIEELRRSLRGIVVQGTARAAR